MAKKFKIGDFLMPLQKHFIRGQIINIANGKYEILVRGSDVRRLPFNHVDRNWKLDENAVIDKLLDKYQN